MCTTAGSKTDQIFQHIRLELCSRPDGPVMCDLNAELVSVSVSKL